MIGSFSKELPEQGRKSREANCADIFIDLRYYKKEQRKSKMAQKSGSVMVVGGGIAGMQAALDLADSGFFVYLVERSSSIGGVMAQLDKTFPTNDCSM
jgi:heterodisulfide reductase subunit A-like polyferredoxin